jgi:hypothetical protein
MIRAPRGSSDLLAMANQIFCIRLRQINPTGKSLLIFRNGVKPRNQKYFPSRPAQISSLICAVPTHRGAFRDRHGRWVGDAVDAAASGTRMRADE